jgi:pimeloyl-ACP methyl ester carboxylesterase
MLIIGDIMSTVVFFPGLRGQASLKQAYTSAVGYNEAALRSVTKCFSWAFEKIDYQTTSNVNPTLSSMEASAAHLLHRVLNHANGEPVICVGSSVGFGVALGALARLNSTASPLGLVGFKPVPDPLHAIELQIRNPQIIANIKNGKIPEIQMPVESTEGEKDTFGLTSRHLNDKFALRALSNPSHFDKLNRNLEGSLEESLIIFGNEDHLTPSVHMLAFDSAVSASRKKIIALNGDHGTDFTRELSHQVGLMIARLG